MLNWLRQRTTLKSTAHKLYGSIVAQARRPEFFQRYCVADTINGRFEMLSLHMFLVLQALKEKGDHADEVSRATSELFFEHVDDAMREMGVGDLKVHKKVHSAASDFYGRLQAYAEPVRSNDLEGLEAALARNLYSMEEPNALTRELAGYVQASLDVLDGEVDTMLTRGEATFAAIPALAA